MNLINLIKGLLNLQKKLDLKFLPSQGLFYKEDFEIWIKRADIGDIIEYEKDYIKDDLGVVITKLKKVVEKNCFFSTGYSFNDVKSIDIVFLFLEIVRFTKGKAVSLSYYNDDKGIEEDIEFSSNYFNYFEIDSKMKTNYNKKEKQFEIEGYKFSLPSIGVENCLTKYLVSKIDKPDAIKYNNFNYDFMFFLGDKRVLTFREIDNLIQIFNFDMEKEEFKKVQKIVKKFQPIQNYSLRKEGKVIEINSKIDLEKIWK